MALEWVVSVAIIRKNNNVEVIYPEFSVLIDGRRAAASRGKPERLLHRAPGEMVDSDGFAINESTIINEYPDKARRENCMTVELDSLAELHRYCMVSGVERLHPEFPDEDDAPPTWSWLNRLQKLPGVQQAMEMPGKVPEILRSFAG